MLFMQGRNEGEIMSEVIITIKDGNYNQVQQNLIGNH